MGAYHQVSFPKVTLKGGCAENLRGNATYYNCFELHAITTCTLPDKPGGETKQETQIRLRNDLHNPIFDRIAYFSLYGSEKYPKNLPKDGSKMRLGLNKAWVQAPPPAKTENESSRIKELHSKFPYWGHVISKSIEDFNEANRRNQSSLRRKLVYDFRSGQADDERWSQLFGGTYGWPKGEDWRRQPSFQYAFAKHPNPNKQYCIIDPPLTAEGIKQAKQAGQLLLTLKEHKFPMPDRVYVSPLYRAMQTFLYAFGSSREGTDHGYILPELREQETGNSADIQIDEWKTGKKRPGPASGWSLFGWQDPYEPWMETGKNEFKMQKRARRVRDEIFTIDDSDSDCVARVTHPLLIRHTIMSLAEQKDLKVLDKFLLDEGGSFAYVIEGNFKKGSGKLKTVRDRMKMLKDNGWQRASPFSKSDYPDWDESTKRFANQTGAKGRPMRQNNGETDGANSTKRPR